MIYFTSDLHFGHANIIQYTNRPFSSVDEMDEELIKRFNMRVRPEDTVYDLGDFAFRDPMKYLSRLNGNIITLKGSHDGDTKSPYMMVIRPKDLLDEYGNQREIVLCHYAMRVWPRSHYASWHLFGHTHGRLESYGLSFDVGVDCWDYYPVSIGAVINKMATLKPVEDYRGKNDRRK